jgi:hypothetical protein
MTGGLSTRMLSDSARTELQADPGWAVGQAIGIGTSIAMRPDSGTS